jgi:branched-subunit amino acid aminotransferase/4-amino-4-deoxychorismate lyase
MIGYSIDKFVDVNLIHIAADSVAVNRGYGAFDFFGIINGKPFFLDRHLDRFFNTMKLLRLRIPHSKQEMEQLILSLVKKNGLDEFHMKLFAYPKADYSGEFINCELYIIPVIIPDNTAYDYVNGVTLITKEYQRFLPEAKSTNYLPLVYLQHEISQAGAVDVLYYSDNYIRETARGNVFMVKSGKIFTPGEKMLKGITRSVVIDILQEHKIPFAETNIRLHELLEADEVFLASTTKKILPVNQINEKRISDRKVGPVSDFLIQHFWQIKKSWGK